MSTNLGKPIEVNLTKFGDLSEVDRQIEQLAEREPSLVRMKARADQLSALSAALCTLRASGTPALVELVDGEGLPNREAVQQAVANLAGLDQLSVHNLVLLCRPWLNDAALEKLNTEAKIESKWMEEWFRASDDPRIHKMPGLPWRSFIRKTVAENVQFAANLLEAADSKEGAEFETEREVLLANFLEAKKKVLCVFPKNWGRA